VKKIVLVLALLAPMTVHAAWLDGQGKPMADTDSMRSDGDFGVSLVLTPDDQKFRQTWNDSKGTPNLASAHTAAIGSSLSVELIFHGCAANAEGNCDVVVDFVVEGPDSRKTNAGHGPVWTGAQPSDGDLYLSETGVTIGFDSTDPVGDYTIVANVKDRVSGRTLSPRSGFVLKK
jgi:hypothetical protein